ncbi:MAG: class I adenylate-forming enzyme family protein [Rhodospirillales bacterium]
MAYGVTQQMIDTFGEVVFKLSLNKQTRRGDAVRNLDFAAIQAARAETGLTDEEIAERVGLLPEQVSVVRVFTERKHHKIDQHRRIFHLGGGKRWKKEDYRSPTERLQFKKEAMMLREALNFKPELVANYIDKGYWINETLNGWLEKHAISIPEATAIIHPGGTLTYKELKSEVDQLTNGLMGLGLMKGDVVAIQLPNTLEFIISYFAITSFGGVMQTIHMPYRDTDIEFLLGHSKARAVICQPDFKDFPTAEVMLCMTQKLTQLSNVITVGNTALAGALAFNSLKIEGTPKIDNPPVGSDPFLLLYTSGTTSNPKGVPLTYQNMIGNARLSVPEFHMTKADRNISAAPFSHLYGLYNFHVALCAGATNILLPTFSPPELAKMIEDTKATTVFLGPPHAATMINAGLIDAHNFSSVRFSMFSGSACPPQLLKTYRDKLSAQHKGSRIGQLWGMTETAGATYCRDDGPEDVPLRSAGSAAPGNEVRVVSPETGEETTSNTVGELQVRGSSVFPGYLDNPEANADAFTKDGWFKTGDIAFIDKTGNLSITGRSKDVISRGGVKFNPADIEDLIMSHPEVEQAAMVPMPDPVLGERACCFITTIGGACITLAELCSLLDNKKIAKNKWPERLETIDEMPMTPTRKIIKGKLIEKL